MLGFVSFQETRSTDIASCFADPRSVVTANGDCVTRVEGLFVPLWRPAYPNRRIGPKKSSLASSKHPHAYSTQFLALSSHDWRPFIRCKSRVDERRMLRDMCISYFEERGCFRTCLLSLIELLAPYTVQSCSNISCIMGINVNIA